MDVKASEIKHFQQLYITKFGIELDDKTARDKLLKLVRQMQTVYRPVTREQMAAYKAKDESVNEDNDDGKAKS